MKSKIFEIIQEIRNIINEPQKLNSIKEDMDKCFASLDVIEDTQEAIDYYKNNELIDNVGYKYLAIHGLLESLYIQQNTLNVLSDFFNLKHIDFKTDYPEIYKIRETRNDISGHPACRGIYSTYLSRISIEKESFEYYKSHTGEFIKVDLLQTIEIQEKFIYTYLKEMILDLLKKEKDMHYKKFQNEKCIDAFEGYFYAREKLHVSGQFYTKEDPLGFDTIKYVLDRFKNCINERYINWKKMYFSYCILEVEEILEYVLSHDDIVNEVNKENKFLKQNLMENLFTKMDYLYQVADEIDKKYEQYFLPPKQSEYQTKMMPYITIENLDISKI